MQATLGAAVPSKLGHFFNRKGDGCMISEKAFCLRLHVFLNAHRLGGNSSVYWKLETDR